jgi:hypothetical protein
MMIRFVPLPDGITTSYPYPYALIKRYGKEEGQRPRTTLAWIISAQAHHGRVSAYRILAMHGSRWNKQAEIVPASNVLATWRHQPTGRSITRAKRSLPKGG